MYSTNLGAFGAGDNLTPGVMFDEQGNYLYRRYNRQGQLDPQGEYSKGGTLIARMRARFMAAQAVRAAERKARAQERMARLTKGARQISPTAVPALIPEAAQAAVQPGGPEAIIAPAARAGRSAAIAKARQAAAESRTMKQLVTQAESAAAALPATPAAAAQAVLAPVLDPAMQIAQQYGINPDDVRKIGPDNIKEYAQKIGTDKLKEYVNKLGADKLKDMASKVGVDALKSYADKLGLDKLKEIPGGDFLKAQASKLLSSGAQQAISKVTSAVGSKLKSLIPGLGGKSKEEKLKDAVNSAMKKAGCKDVPGLMNWECPAGVPKEISPEYARIFQQAADSVGYSLAGADEPKVPIYVYAMPVILTGIAGLGMWLAVRGSRQN